MICLLCKSTQDPIVLMTSTIPTKQKLPIFFLFSNLKTSHPEMVLKAFTSYHFIHSMNYFILDPNQQQSATSGTRCLMKEREGEEFTVETQTSQGAFFVTITEGENRVQGRPIS